MYMLCLGIQVMTAGGDEINNYDYKISKSQ